MDCFEDLKNAFWAPKDRSGYRALATIGTGSRCAAQYMFIFFYNLCSCSFLFLLRYPVLPNISLSPLISENFGLVHNLCLFKIP